MEIVTDNNQLDYELQEMHIESSHWLSDISFVEGEVKFLKNALHKYTTLTENLQVNEAANFTKILALQEITAASLKTKILKFLKFIEPVIIDSKRAIGVDLVEEFIALETEIKSLSGYIKLVKELVFGFIEEAIKTGKYTDTCALPKV